ncbi:hypothetical protein IQ243_28075 [Nostocales cyanobacterium LEGE 11386]|nr:hypothetical protein [Nostocales cyanobacterium LEGE 11386]
MLSLLSNATCSTTALRASCGGGDPKTAVAPQHSALSTQHSALSTQHSALSTQHSALSTHLATPDFIQNCFG